MVAAMLRTAIPGDRPIIAQAMAEGALEIDRLTVALAAAERDLKIQKAVADLAYIPHQQLTASNEKLRLQLTASESLLRRARSYLNFVNRSEGWHDETAQGVRTYDAIDAYLAKGDRS